MKHVQTKFEIKCANLVIRVLEHDMKVHGPKNREKCKREDRTNGILRSE